MTDQTRDIVERVARAIYADAQAEARKLGAPEPLPTFEEDEEDSRLLCIRMAKAAIEAAGVEALTKRVAELEETMRKIESHNQRRKVPGNNGRMIDVTASDIQVIARAALSNAARGEEG
jgi:hypothetical protein